MLAAIEYDQKSGICAWTAAGSRPVSARFRPDTNTSVDMDKTQRYREVRSRLDALVQPDTDWFATLSTVCGELHNAFDAFHWTGFYRTVRPAHLQVGPYQGGHGCIDIAFGRGVCGTSAAEKRTIRLADVHSFPGHIACSSTTRSEIVTPVVTFHGEVVAVLDVDSDWPDAFDEVDERELESLCAWLSERAPDGLRSGAHRRQD